MHYVTKFFFEWYFKSSGLQLLYKGFCHWCFPANLWNKRKIIWKLWQIHRKTLMSQFLFNNVAGLQLLSLIKADLPTNIFHKVFVIAPLEELWNMVVKSVIWQNGLKNDLLKFCRTIHVFLRNFRIADRLSTTEAALQRFYQKKVSGNMQQIYRRTSMLKCDFNKLALQFYWSHFSAWVFSYKFDAFFRTPLLRNTCGGSYKVPLNACLWKTVKQKRWKNIQWSWARISCMVSSKQ